MGARSAVKRAKTVVEYCVTAMDTVYPISLELISGLGWLTLDKSIKYIARLYSPRGRSCRITLAEPRIKSNRSITDCECLLTPSGTH